MFRILSKSLRTGVLTEQDPFKSSAGFAFPLIDFTRCTNCDECARVCPTAAIQSGTTASGQKTKSEVLGIGDDEFEPWKIGATM